MELSSLRTPINIRSASQGDLPTLLEFEQGIIAAERPMDHTLKPDPISYYDVEALIASADAEVAVAEIDETLIGSGYARKATSRSYLQPAFHAEIGFLYVRAPHRGKGVNKMILEHLFSWAQENDLPEIHLSVYPTNQPALRAYEKVGFEPYLVEMRLNLEEQK